MEKIFFKTEEDALDFLIENGIETDSDKAMSKLKENGYIEETIIGKIEKAEEEYNNYKYEKRDIHNPRNDLLKYLQKDKKLLDLLYKTIQYLKKKLEIMEKINNDNSYN